MQFKLDKDVEFILEQLNNNGTGFLVGGALRDIILNNDPGDYDFATNIDYNILKRIFLKNNPKEVGNHFGILMVTVNGKSYEIAKFREEKGIYNSRYPKKINFVNNIEKDLCRRDFTINAMAYNKNSGLIDLYDGIEDIKNKKIKFVGNAKLRIEEDALRLMRAFRFMSKLGFDLDKKTAEAIYEKRKFLNKISKERIFDEFSQILMGDYAKKALNEMKKLGVLETIIPEFKYTYNFNQKILETEKKDNLFKHTIKTVENCEKDIITRLAAFLHDIGKINTKTIDAKGNITYVGHEVESSFIAEEVLKFFRVSNEMTMTVKKLVLYHNLAYKDYSDKVLKKLILEIGTNNVKRLENLLIADLNSKYSEDKKKSIKKVENFIGKIEKIIENGEIVDYNDIDITGVDLLNLNFDKLDIKKIKDDVYDRILEDKLENKKEKILQYILKKYKLEYNLMKEKSCGAVIYNKNINKYLLVKMYNGNWGFPKGHMEEKESEIETAIREVKEETNINIEIKENFREIVQYVINEKILKEVVFFIGMTLEENVSIETDEIEEYAWCSYEEALKLITFKMQRDVLEKVGNIEVGETFKI